MLQFIGIILEIILLRLKWENTTLKKDKNKIKDEFDW